MYNFKPNRFCKYQRKIALEDITKVFAAKSSLSVLIKVPHEYDYYVHLKEKESFDEFIEVMEKSVDIEFTTDAELKPLATNNADKSSMGSPRPNRYKHAPSALEYASRQSEREMKKRGCTVCHTESKEGILLGRLINQQIGQGGNQLTAEFFKEVPAVLAEVRAAGWRMIVAK
eukprot:Stramenopile-MAST_4_protein_5398